MSSADDPTSSSSSPTHNLRDHLLKVLSTHPGTRTFHLHVLLTAPRKSNALYPFATPRPPRVYVQDILVILSEQPPTPLDAPRVIVSAIEATVYHIPTTSSAVLYVSKVDSTGHTGKVGGAPSPTGVLVRGLLGFYADRRTRPEELAGVRWLWIQLFARAQMQYLFAGSGEWEGKKALGDRGLCAWWRRVLGRVVGDVVGDKKEEGVGVKMYYVLPGFNEAEAEHTLRIAEEPATSSAAKLPEGVKWVYGHPYSQPENEGEGGMSMPCPVDEKEENRKNLGRFIPYYDDCPKSRFLDEIAYTTGDIKSPQKKRARTITGADGGGKEERDRELKKEKEEKKDEQHKPPGEMGKVTPDEFWERMGFRQECVAGAVTGFFTVIFTSPSSSGLLTKSPLEPRPGQVASQVNKRVMTTLLTGVEFSTVELAVKATEMVEGAIKGLCEGIAVVKKEDNPRSRTPERETSSKFLLEPPKTPPRGGAAHLPEVSPNPFPEPVASLETYLGYIYGSVSTANAVEKKVEKEKDSGHVTVLAVRRKKKKAV